MKKILSLSIAFFILAFAPAQNYWVKITDNGFGNTATSSTSAVPILKQFKNALYMTTLKKGSVGFDTCKLYKSPTGLAGSFNLVYSQPSTASSKGFCAIGTTNEGGGFMFLNQSEFNGGSAGVVHKSSDGQSFTPFYYYDGGDVIAILPFKGTGTADSMYIFLKKSPQNQILRSIHSNPDATNGWENVYNVETNGELSGASVHNNRLFAIEKNRKKIYTKNSGGQFDSIHNINFPNQSQFNKGFSAIGSFISKNKLYVGTTNYQDGTELWESSNNGLSWTFVNKFPGYQEITSISEHSNELWITLSSNNNNPPKVLKSTNGSTFVVVLNSNYGNPQNNGKYGITEILNNNIFYACQPNLNGNSTLLKTCFGTPPPSNFLGNDTSICKGRTITLKAPVGYTYLWNTGQTTQSITTDSSHVYHCEITDSANTTCVNGDDIKIRIDSIPNLTRTSPSTSPHTVCSGQPVAVAYQSNYYERIETLISNTTSKPIPPSSANNDFINVINYWEEANITLEAVRIDSLFSNGVDNSKLELKLIAPNGTPISLLPQNITNGQNFLGTTFKRGATLPIGSGGAPYSGVYKPNIAFESLSPSIPTNGSWKLQITNYDGNNTAMLKGWSIIFSHKDTVLNYTWSSSLAPVPSPTPGLLFSNNNPPNSANLITSIAPAATATYTLTTTNSKGCVKIDSFKLIVPTFNIINNDTTLCYSSSIQLTSTGNTATNWYEIATPNNIYMGNGASVTIVPPSNATTTYYAQHYASPCIIYDTVKITVTPPFSVTASANPGTICLGGPSSLTATSTNGIGIINYAWNAPVTGNPQSVTVSPNTTTTYTINATDSIGCTASYTVNVIVNPNTQITVKSKYLVSQNVTGGNVVIFEDTSTTSGIIKLDTVGNALSITNGLSTINTIPAGNYWIKVFPDIGQHPDLIPTYYDTTGNSYFQWDSVITTGIAQHGCSQNDTFKVNVIQMLPLGGSGLGHLRGRIIEGDGFNRTPGDPIGGADVKGGRKPPGGNSIVMTGTTDANGWYDFNNIPLNNPGEKYVIYADIPGYGLDSTYEVALDASNPTQLQLNYYVDSNTIWIDSTIHITTAIIANQPISSNNLSIYPNPSKGITSINYSINTDAEVTINLYNVMGVKLEQLLHKKQSNGSYTINFDNATKFPPGMYFILLKVNDKTTIARMIITK